MLMSTSPGAEGGGGGGESWCGHELLNTVTTEWVKDHLYDPEVCPYIQLARLSCFDTETKICFTRYLVPGTEAAMKSGGKTVHGDP